MGHGPVDSNGFQGQGYADPPPSGGESFETPPMGHGPVDVNVFHSEMGYEQQVPDYSSQDMYQNQQSDEPMIREDPFNEYNMYADTTGAEQQYQTDSQQFDQNQYAAASDDVFPQELGDPLNHHQFDPDMDSIGLPENAIGNDSFSSDEPPVDPLDERIERAINGELEFVPQVEDDLKEQFPEVASDGPIGLHDKGKTVAHDDEDIYRPEDSLEDNEAVAESPEAINLEDVEAPETDPRIPEELRSDEEKTEETSAGWVEEDPEEDEHYELPDWVVGNAEPLAPPHLSGAEKVAGHYHLDTMAPREGEATAPTTDTSSGLVNTGKPPQRQDQTASVPKPAARRIRRVASPTHHRPTKSPVFLDSVTNELVEGDQVKLGELTFWMSEAKVQKWCKKVGDRVHVGETLMEVACDTKISKETLQWAPTQDVKATSNGFLVAKHFGVGEMISLGWTVGVIGTSTEGLPTADPEPIISFVDEDISEEYDEPKEKPTDVELSNPSQKKKTRAQTIPKKEAEARMKKQHDGVKKSKPSTTANKRETPTVKHFQKETKQEAKNKPGWKSFLSVDWEPKVVKMDHLNHVLIPFLQKKMEAWERNAKFQLPATSSLDQEVLTSSKTKMTIRWEPQTRDNGRKKSRAEKRKKLRSQHCFASLPAVSWQFEKSELPPKSTSPAKKEKRTRQIFFFDSKEGVPRKEHGRERLGGKTRWDSFPRIIKWENMTHPLPRRQYPKKPDAEDKEQSDLALPQQNMMVYATPMARAAARMANLDLQFVSGTGDGGRITLDDVKDVLYPMLMKEQEKRQKQQQHEDSNQEQSSQEESSQSSSLVTTTSSPLQQSPKNKKKKSRPVQTLRIRYASPMARRLADEYQIDLATVRGSGPRGRILLDDVQKALDEQTRP
mmetsp:Transcript_16694/g.40695  ORF Transcript_16694/g.40695 Transcript_16694/m.40695 type:complete len:895 (-) Transcript_16694:130-2814(-)